VSILQEVEQMNERVLARIRELEPLVEEHRRLQELLERFAFDASQDARGSARARATGGGGAERRGAKKTARTPIADTQKAADVRSRKRRRAPHARVGERRDQVLAIVRGEPGVTVAQIGARLGVDPTGLYRVVRQLQSDGAVLKEGSGLKPTATPAGVEARLDGPSSTA